MEEKISVIVPVYNVEKYLEECLLSIINQSYKNLEIICVNDGSTDNCAKILEEFAIKDPRIVVLTQKNQGVSVARNTGIRASTGAYISFIDSDDYISEDFFLELYSILKDHNADIAWANINYVNEKYELLIKEPSYKSVAYSLAEKIALAKHGYVCSKLYRSDFIKENNLLFEEGVVIEDQLYLIQALYWSGVSVTTNKVSYFYKQRLGSITHNEKVLEKVDKDQLHSITRIIDFAIEKNFDKKALKEVKNFIYITSTNRVLEELLNSKYFYFFGKRYFLIKKLIKKMDVIFNKFLDLEIIRFFYKKIKNSDGSHTIRLLKLFKFNI